MTASLLGQLLRAKLPLVTGQRCCLTCEHSSETLDHVWFCQLQVACWLSGRPAPAVHRTQKSQDKAPFELENGNFFTVTPVNGQSCTLRVPSVALFLFPDACTNCPSACLLCLNVACCCRGIYGCSSCTARDGEPATNPIFPARNGIPLKPTPETSPPFCPNGWVPPPESARPPVPPPDVDCPALPCERALH